MTFFRTADSKPPNYKHWQIKCAEEWEVRIHKVWTQLEPILHTINTAENHGERTVTVTCFPSSRAL